HDAETERLERPRHVSRVVAEERAVQGARSRGERRERERAVRVALRSRRPHRPADRAVDGPNRVRAGRCLLAHRAHLYCTWPSGACAEGFVDKVATGATLKPRASRNQGSKEPPQLLPPSREDGRGGPRDRSRKADLGTATRS